MWTHSYHGFQVPRLKEDRFSPVVISCGRFPAKRGRRRVLKSEVLEPEALKTGEGGRRWLLLDQVGGEQVSREPGTDGRRFGHRCRPTDHRGNAKTQEDRGSCVCLHHVMRSSPGTAQMLQGGFGCIHGDYI